MTTPNSLDFADRATWTPDEVLLGTQFCGMREHDDFDRLAESLGIMLVSAYEPDITPEDMQSRMRRFWQAGRFLKEIGGQFPDITDETVLRAQVIAPQKSFIGGGYIARPDLLRTIAAIQSDGSSHTVLPFTVFAQKHPWKTSPVVGVAHPMLIVRKRMSRQGTDIGLERYLQRNPMSSAARYFDSL